MGWGACALDQPDRNHNAGLPSHDNSIRRVLASHFLLPLLRNCHASAKIGCGLRQLTQAFSKIEAPPLRQTQPLGQVSEAIVGVNENSRAAAEGEVDMISSQFGTVLEGVTSACVRCCMESSMTVKFSFRCFFRSGFLVKKA